MLQHTAPYSGTTVGGQVYGTVEGDLDGSGQALFALGESFKLSLHLLHVKMSSLPPLWGGFFMVLTQTVRVAWF